MHSTAYVVGLPPHWQVVVFIVGCRNMSLSTSPKHPALPLIAPSVYWLLFRVVAPLRSLVIASRIWPPHPFPLTPLRLLLHTSVRCCLVTLLHCVARLLGLLHIAPSHLHIPLIMILLVLFGWLTLGLHSPLTSSFLLLVGWCLPGTSPPLPSIEPSPLNSRHAPLVRLVVMLRRTLATPLSSSLPYANWLDSLFPLPPPKNGGKHLLTKNLPTS